MIGAMITMYAAVASRTGEIGTLRALGFRRASASWPRSCVESLLLGLVGGVVGLVGRVVHAGAVTISTMNWQSFAELAFSFQLTPGIVVAVARLRAGDGAASAGSCRRVRAARMKIVDALRAA